MKKEAYNSLKTIEDTWWYQGRLLALDRAVKKADLQTTQNALDVGTGFGGMHRFLSSFGKVYGVEINDEARKVASRRGYEHVADSLDGLTERDYDLIGAFDVIEHIEDDEEFVRRLFRRTKRGGALLATVPAFQFLFSEHDRIHMHFRRYSKKRFERLLEGAGYEIGYIGYWNRTLFPVAVLLRILGKGSNESLRPPNSLERIMNRIMRLEAKSSFPYVLPGLSLVVIAKKR